MIAMESKGYEREEAEGLAWMIFFRTFSVVDFLVLWVDKAEVVMEAREEEMIWYTL